MSDEHSLRIIEYLNLVMDASEVSAGKSKMLKFEQNNKWQQHTTKFSASRLNIYTPSMVR